ncbi:MAG TPA: hypothetical protein VGE47_13825, partial [Burkholderiaceae bacterium]
LAGLLLAWLLLFGSEQWLGADPGSKLIEHFTVLLAALVAMLVWAALWSLVNQLFRRHFPLTLHLRATLLATVVIELVEVATPVLAYAFSAPGLLNISALATAVGGTLLVWWQASLIWPRARRTLGLVLLTLLVGGHALSVARRPDQQFWFRPSYVSALPPPALRVASPKPPQALIDALKSLEAELQTQASRDEKGEPVDNEEE